jgi:hypothetical protein
MIICEIILLFWCEWIGMFSRHGCMRTKFHYWNKGWSEYINLWRKVVCLFCFVPMRSIKVGCFRSHAWSLWKALDKEGCMGLVLWHLDLGEKVFEYWMSSLLNQIKLELKISECVRYEFLSDFCCWKFKWIPKKQVLKGKVSWERGNTRANGTGHTSVH